MKRRVYLYLLLELIIGVILSCYIYQRYLILINITNSLPNKLFIVDKWQIPKEKSQYFAFISPNNPYYQNNIFVKQVAGLEGDLVKIHHHELYINHQYLGKIKTLSQKGYPLKASHSGRINKDYFFAYSPHIDSYDSRYEEIGWISKSHVVGRAYPFF